ncbi:alternative ribosome rescue aminoacyl-tRNA hydrolase ArfB [Winogradskyella sp.]|nr:alternative ribosome rescue aminoacyl-tRNA hydrolase ArfB [Winogradskyella sp.]MDB9782852.1 alternative ribosome rescue aminoacyl-tRNA hydrolase ArfB [Winogradskyella sp.]MDC0007005.1 alternative ribosome rescue aminoacyl-tRNA hydrolase ArfB [Winogradskyella sp.]MDC0009339.1 alternative ribosome rescue aminoacyl-tRNA hydrolase ArfB [Winogradskyella sp.]MDC1503883.1 alternative ribosome rescue aminoacyl-tRNA hydrolase ArfB [Winogradskyella sp.]
MNIEFLKSELTYKYVRSSGSGGQHVNKVSSKAELYFNLENSQVFNEVEKLKLSQFFNNRLNKEGSIVLACDESRSQFRNKAIVTQRFLALIEEGLKEDKQRIATKIPRAVKRKRLKAKRITSTKKTNRKPPIIE